MHNSNDSGSHVPSESEQATATAFSSIPEANGPGTKFTEEDQQQQGPRTDFQLAPEGNILIQVKALIPLLYYNVTTLEGRQNYTENFVARGRFSGIISWSPFIILMAVPCDSAAKGILSAFCISFYINVLLFYRSTYNPRQDRVMMIDGINFLLYFSIMIASYATRAWPNVPFNCHLIAPIQTSAIFLAAILSVLFCYPFTLQYAKAKDEIPLHVIQSMGFKKVNMLLTLVWLLLFAVMTLSSWLDYFYFSSKGSENAAGAIILGSVLPLVLVGLGIILMPILAQYFKKKSLPKKKDSQHPPSQPSV
jgi:hypothetical protein